jgi:hypothetical protein
MIMAKQSKPKNIIANFFKEINSANHSPRFQIVVASGVLELFVNTLVELKCKNGKHIAGSSDFTYSIKLILLHEKGLITDSQYTVLDAFRKLRNKAAHGAQFKLTRDMLVPFKNIFPNFKLGDLSNPNNFNIICYTIVCNFSDYNFDLFTDYFGPDLYEVEKPEGSIK